MAKAIMTSVKLPASIERKMLRQIIDDGYGMRGKSKWITEAIYAFLAMHDYPELVEIASDMEDLVRVVSMRFPEELLLKLDDALVEVRKLHPTLEGVQSNIIRASILQRLIRERSVNDR
jgi:hypothetical protein